MLFHGLNEITLPGKARSHKLMCFKKESVFILFGGKRSEIVLSTAVLRKVVLQNRESVRNNAERYYG